MTQAKEFAGKGAGVIGVRLEVAQHIDRERGLKIYRKVMLTVDGLSDQGPITALGTAAKSLF